MKIHRFIGQYDLSKKAVEITNPETVKQIKDVLRIKKGEKIILSDGKGAEAEVVIDSISAKKITGIIAISARTTLAGMRVVNLYLSILKKENFELAVQKAVECGVAKIIPVITERTIKTGLNIPRLQKIILEASEQSGRNIVPTLSPILKFNEAINTAEGKKIIFTPSLASDGVHPANDLTLHPLLSKGEGTKNTKSIFIGPEGGFTEKEIVLAKENGFMVASLGPLTLRGETAAIVATYLAVYHPLPLLN